MHRTADIAAAVHAGPTSRDELVGWVAGLGFTLALFLGLAHSENIRPSPPPATVVDLRAVSIPLEAPPPPPRLAEAPPPPDSLPAFAGLEAGVSDSAVRIAVVPPDLEALVPSTREPPRAVIQPGYLHTEFKPRIASQVEDRRIYQVTDVDQPPRAVVRMAPSLPSDLYGDTRSLRVVMLVLIDADGSVANVRVLQPSGQPIFDRAAMEVVRTFWEFTPAVRRGKKVKCLAQQALRVNLGSASPFELP